MCGSPICQSVDDHAQSGQRLIDQLGLLQSHSIRAGFLDLFRPGKIDQVHFPSLAPAIDEVLLADGDHENAMAPAALLIHVRAPHHSVHTPRLYQIHQLLGGRHVVTGRTFNDPEIPILIFADGQIVVLACRVEKIANALHINLHKRHLDGKLKGRARSFDGLKKTLGDARHDTRVFRVPNEASHCVCLSGASLSISEYCAIVPFQHFRYNGLRYFFIDLRLSV
mmetsp:Transcript_24556/g.40411  ORF Transcript_24556/g.40411 Transcript_24556/m.40411 type:complete len:224 (+) Transcript_24556:1410-2081(+)